MNNSVAGKITRKTEFFYLYIFFLPYKDKYRLGKVQPKPVGLKSFLTIKLWWFIEKNNDKLKNKQKNFLLSAALNSEFRLVFALTL